MPDELYQAVIAYAGGKKFSTTVCELVRRGLNPDQPKVQPEYNQSMNLVHPKVIPDEWLQQVRQEISKLKESNRFFAEKVVRLEQIAKEDCDDISEFKNLFRQWELNYSYQASQIEGLQGREVKTNQRFEDIEHRLTALEQREVILEVQPEVIPEVIPEASGEALPGNGVIPEVIPKPEKHVALMMAPTDPDEKIHVTQAVKNQVIERVDYLKGSGMAVKDIAVKAGINYNSFRKLINPEFNKSQNITRREFSALMNIKPGDDCNKQEPGTNQS
ncbi:hypothetical protein DLD82_10810 [Methanospirillum stamsii]|uniref:Uncharacterized protein n=2 Tax=Methanospirillum stamsii TaxID=1277351 RepID=A0A2V2N0T2_9EURY|nr:hypothetical protein DLD82_10810 [Methanospirillum stamsii]